MNYRQTARGVELAASPDFDLKQTLDCGQCFRWDLLPDGSFCGTAFDRRLRLSEENGSVIFHGVSAAEFEQVWAPYFDLDFDYAAVRRALAEQNPVLKQAAEFAPGIRILRQDPWEALCSFIISQNNNIPRIKGIIARLCETFGENCGGLYTFPGPGRLAGLGVEALAPLRSGFRAKYILSAAEKVASGEVDLGAVSVMPMEQARESLMTICGVGEKVAECVLLYGLHRLEAFPMDVWMKRAMSVLLPDRAREDFGEYAGIAQQYLFHYSRCHADLFSA